MFFDRLSEFADNLRSLLTLTFPIASGKERRAQAIAQTFKPEAISVWV